MPTLSITFTAAQATRIQTAFAARLNKPTPDMQDLKTWIIEQIKNIVIDSERDAAIKTVQQSFVADTFDPT